MNTIPNKNASTPEALENIACTYSRVSTTEHADEGCGLREQENSLRSYCAAHGYTNKEIHTDPGVSGATMERPVLNKLIQKDAPLLMEGVSLATENDCDLISFAKSLGISNPPNHLLLLKL